MNTKKYRWNITKFLKNMLFVITMITVAIMMVTFFSAPALDITAEAFRDYMLTMSNIIVIEFILYFILWLKDKFFQ